MVPVSSDILSALSRFFENSGVPLSLADTALEDCPLILVNAAFERLTGYAAEDVLGRNCRFLQPAGAALAVRARIRAFIADPGLAEDRFAIPNQARDGRRFVNLLYLARLRARGGRTFILGSQFDLMRSTAATGDAYDRTLAEDLDAIRLVSREFGAVVLGNFRTLASSASLIAQAKLDAQRDDG